MGKRVLRFLKKKMNLLKKKQPLGHYVLVYWSDVAENKALGYDFLKKIVHFYNGNIIKVENYSIPKMTELKRDGIFVKDMTLGEMIPKASKFIPDTYQVLGRLQITKRL